MNDQRRHMSVTQLGLVAARAMEWYAKKAKERQKTGQERGRKAQKGIPADLPETADAGDARDKAGEAFGAGDTTRRRCQETDARRWKKRSAWTSKK